MPTKYQTPFAKSKLLAITCGWLVCLFVADATAVAQQYPGIKCIIDGHHQCQIRYSVEFGQGTIYFASQNAVEQFETLVIDKIKLGQEPRPSLVLKANHQLAVTGQVQQKFCPVTGKPTNKEHQLLIGGVSIFFHDMAAKKKMEALDSTWHRARQVFAPDMFAKSFSVSIIPAQQEGIAIADGSTKHPTVKAASAQTQPAKR